MSTDWRNMWSASQNGTASASPPANPDPKNAPYGTVIVDFVNEAMTVPLPRPDAQLRVLKATLSEKTGLRPDQMTLSSSGFRMKDDNAPLLAYGIFPPAIQGEDPKQQSAGGFSGLMKGFKDTWGITSSASDKWQPKRILLRANQEALAAQSKKADAAKATQTESGLIDRITHIRDTAIEPFLPKFEAVKNTPPAERQDQDFLILSEGLLQALLKLDGIEVPHSEWTEARKCRKESVRKVQGYLDQADQMKEEHKEFQKQQKQ